MESPLRYLAFIGESGSGKSTTASLLRSLERAQHAELVVDGTPVTDLPAMRVLELLEPTTTLIPQMPELFANSVRFNVTLGYAASDEEIHSYLEQARFTEVLKRLPRGLDTKVNEKGVNLSGGERQRLALARGLFFARASSIIILDEPTSSVDPVNERQIYERLLSSRRDATIISVLHKRNLLPLFDYVYVFDNGKVVEHGSYTELAARNSEALKS
jgi:ATP-binding cassette, subfamily B, bacterial